MRAPAAVTAALAAAVVLLGAACGGDSGGPADGADGPDCPTGDPERLAVVVDAEVPHDPAAFTQGLVSVGDRLYESTGLEGSSGVRELDPRSGEVLQVVENSPDQFGEGLAVGEDGELVQLTWTEGVALRRDPDDLEEVGRFAYDGEGWGLTTLDDGTLVMSDGTATLQLRDPSSFEVLDTVEVSRSGGGADRLNELEWDGTHLWANRWQTDEILRIDLGCGTVDGVVDARELTSRAAEVAAAEGSGAIDVLNGIALAPGGDDGVLLTGKRWPVMFRARVVEGDPAVGGTGSGGTGIGG